MMMSLVTIRGKKKDEKECRGKIKEIKGVEIV